VVAHSPDTIATAATPLKRLVGKRMNSVVLILDYTQFAFDGAGLTAVTSPVVEAGSHKLQWKEPGYFDTLCRLAGKVVTSAEIVPEFLALGFEEGSTLRISLRDEDYEAAEAVLFKDDSGWWVL
jgi:hypothetical protein